MEPFLWVLKTGCSRTTVWHRKEKELHQDVRKESILGSLQGCLQIRFLDCVVLVQIPLNFAWSNMHDCALNIELCVGLIRVEYFIGIIFDLLVCPQPPLHIIVFGHNFYPLFFLTANKEVKFKSHQTAMRPPPKMFEEFLEVTWWFRKPCIYWVPALNIATDFQNVLSYHWLKITN